MGTEELTNWCPDCNSPCIETRCDDCQRHYDMEEAGGARSSASEAEGRHDLSLATVEVAWGPDMSYPCGWWWVDWETLEHGARQVEPEWVGPFATSTHALEDAKTDEDRPRFSLGDDEDQDSTDDDEPAPPGRAAEDPLHDRTQTRCAVRTRYLGFGRWSVTDGGAFDRPARRLVYRGDHQRNEDGHRAAADAWLGRFVRTDREYPFPDAAVHNLGLAFGADDKYWTWNLDGGKQ